MAFKMYGKTPMTKALVGKQKNLPANLRAAIEAAPETPMNMYGKSPMNKYATDAELMAAEKAKLNKDARQQDGKGKTDKEKSSMKKYASDAQRKAIHASKAEKKSSMKKRGCGCKSGACMCK
tara:strand:+ start:220 stop:585 length:366 start_codon:yes stop_codon:yes gene_type:complete